MRQDTPLSLLAVVLSLTACRGPAPRQQSPVNAAQNIRFGTPWYRSNDAPGWYNDALLGVESEPDYAGSDDNETEAGAALQALYRAENGDRYFANVGEVGAWLPLDEDLVLGTVLEYEEGRDNENDALEGFEDVEDTIEAQITLAKRFGDFSLAGVLQPEIVDEGKGFVTFVAGSYDTMLTDKLRFDAGIDVSFGDAEHMATEFGVTTGASQASGLDRYTPGAGLKSSSLGLGLEYFVSNQLSLIGSLELEYYFSKAADSPLIEDEGSELTFGGALGLRWSF